MQTSAYEAEQAVARARHEELEFSYLAGVLLEVIKRTLASTTGVEEGPGVDAPLLIDQMNPRRGRVRALAVLFGRIVRGEKSGTRYGQVKQCQSYEPELELAPADHFAPALARMRGSAQKSNKSARKFP